MNFLESLLALALALSQWGILKIIIQNIFNSYEREKKTLKRG